MVSIALAFAAGLVAFVSPCFLPIVPVLAAYLSGNSVLKADVSPTLRMSVTANFGADGFVSGAPVGQGNAVGGSGTDSMVDVAPRSNRSDGPHTIGGLRGSLAFMAGFSVVFLAFWAAVAALGLVVADARPILRVVGGVVLVVFGAAMVGLIRLPSTIRFAVPALGSGAATPWQAFALGAAFGAGGSPCFGPLLATVLGLILTAETALVGLGLLSVFCLGLGIPVVLATLGVGSILTRLGWVRRYGHQIQVVGGVVIMLFGVLMISDLLGSFSATIWNLS